MKIDYEQMYLDNEKLAYKFCSSYKLLGDEDMVQNIKLSLFRACTSYSPTKKVAFSTFAYRCMYNEYMYHFRNKHLKLEFANPIVNDDTGKCTYLIDILKDETIENFDDAIYKKEILDKVYAYLNTINDIKKNIYLDFYIQGFKKNQIAVKYNIPAVKVSKIIKDITTNLQELLIKYK